ncbi:peptidoglycan-binding protein [Priestia megaterium]|uniref:cell wall hydrolase n=1 Tax=Priestia TaxID=2800373 RepID=UPI000D507CA3|nr:cell wall hydrolase [Priestia megaterium]MBU8853086.1 cell wall hydrolase [Bacillus sp. FJAT-26377]PVC73913.1 peptidoglycan-binding protein [Priestia megaterium]
MFKKLAIIGALAVPMFGMNHGANAAETTHRVKSGETLYKIGAEYGVTVKQLKEANHKSTDSINANETLTIPNSISESDKDLLARLVQAEAKGEPYAGKVAVATVVLNRVDSDSFPNSIHDVIYQGTQFTPVQNGEINKAADAEAKKAVNEALAFRGQGKGSLFFFNPDKTSDQWLRQKQVTITIGNHVFAK